MGSLGRPFQSSPSRPSWGQGRTSWGQLGGHLGTFQSAILGSASAIFGSDGLGKFQSTILGSTASHFGVTWVAILGSRSATLVPSPVWPFWSSASRPSWGQRRPSWVTQVAILGSRSAILESAGQPSWEVPRRPSRGHCRPSWGHLSSHCGAAPVGHLGVTWAAILGSAGRPSWVIWSAILGSGSAILVPPLGRPSWECSSRPSWGHPGGHFGAAPVDHLGSSTRPS